MAKDLFKIAKQKKIKYFLISFVDLFGVLRSKLVPAHAIKEMQTAGAGFAGFAAWLDMTPADSDMFGIPDPDSLIQLPWNKEVGWLASDLWMNGKPVEASPRVMLKNQIKKLKKQKKLTKFSEEEQKSAGLDQCSDQEFEILTNLNNEYRSNFEFPFIIAVRGLGKNQIIDNMKKRVNNSKSQEFETAINEIHKIAKLRIIDLPY